MIISFIGHRDRLANPDHLRAIERTYPGARWAHGGAVGFDAQVDGIATALGKSVEDGSLIVIRPEYDECSARAAPIIRNKTIIEMADLVCAGYDGREMGGTHDAVIYARKCGRQILFLDVNR